MHHQPVKRKMGGRIVALVSVLLFGGAGCTSQAPIAVSSGALQGLRSSVVSEQSLRATNAISVAPVTLEPGLSGADAAELTSALVEAMNAEWGSSAFSGDAANADAVLQVHVRELTSREGSSVGAQKMAQVSCDMSLRTVRSSQLIWRGDYVFHDKPLSDNLFELSRRREGGGSGWKQGHELLTAAFRAAARDLANRREELFVRCDGGAKCGASGHQGMP